jgi:hypothetical protein
MAEIFEFPSSDIRLWTVIERATRTGLVGLGFYGAAAIDHAVGVYKELYDKHLAGEFKATVPDEACRQHMLRLGDFFYRRMEELYGTLVLHEAHWYEYGKPFPNR